MQTPNKNGVYAADHQDIMARHDRSYAAVNLCQCEDGLYRYGLDLMYSYGGFAFPIFATAQGYASYSAARDAGTQQLLQHFPAAWPSEPQSVHDELRILKGQIEQHFRQPSLF